MYGFADDPDDTPAAEFTAPRSAFLIASAAAADGPALACGGWRTASTKTAEIKRLYVDPAVRGRGLGRRILEALEEDAVSHGLAHVILETGVHNRAALSLYATRGYAPVKSYVESRNPDINRAMQKALRGHS